MLTVEYRHSEIRDEFKELAQTNSPNTVVVSGGSQTLNKLKFYNLSMPFVFAVIKTPTLDPLGFWQRDKVRDLQLSHHDLSENDFDKEYNVGSFGCWPRVR